MSVDHQGDLYDRDFNQMPVLPAACRHLRELLQADNAGDAIPAWRSTAGRLHGRGGGSSRGAARWRLMMKRLLGIAAALLAAWLLATRAGGAAQPPRPLGPAKRRQARGGLAGHQPLPRRVYVAAAALAARGP